MELSPGVEDGATIGGLVVGGTTGSVLFVGPGSTLAQDNANFFWNDTNNRLGIGTASPASILQLTGASSTLTITPAANTETVGINMTNVTGTVRGFLTSNINSGEIRFGGSSGGYFPTIYSQGAEVVRILTTGLMGIGTSVPLAKLHVVNAHNDATGLLRLQVADGDAQDNAGLSFFSKATSPTTNARNWQISNNYQAFGNLDFLMSASATASPTTHVASFTRDGRLGIGTSAPGTLLQVGGTTGANTLTIGGGVADLRLDFSTSGTVFHRINSNANTGFLDIMAGVAGSGHALRFFTGGSGGGTEAMRITPTQLVGIGVTPTAVLHLKAGTATANTAPLKFNSGTLNTTAEAGAMEFLTDDYYATITTGAARKGIVLNDGTNLTSGRIPFATTNGRLTDDADLTFATDTLTSTKIKANSAGGYISSDGSTGATGTFTTADAKTVTVKDGIITSIV